MDLSRANSEAYFIFHKSREALDRTIKITTGALRDVERRSAADVHLVTTIVAATGEPWGTKFALSDKHATLIDDTIGHLSRLWVAHVYSLFEMFLTEVRADLDRWRRMSTNKPVDGRANDEKGNLALESLVVILGGTPNALEPNLTHFRFFEALRHCVVHRAGLATTSLVELRKILPPLVSSKRDGRPGPELPDVSLQTPILLKPRHSILASEVTYRLARQFNSLLVQSLGEDGVVCMAANHAILRNFYSERHRWFARPEMAINMHLSNRYRIKIGRGHRTDCIATLKRLGHWDKVRRHFEGQMQSVERPARPPTARPVGPSRRIRQ